MIRWLSLGPLKQEAERRARTGGPEPYSRCIGRKDRISCIAFSCSTTSRDYEYTDWDDLRAFADEFGALVHDVSTGSAYLARGPRVA